MAVEKIPVGVIGLNRPGAEERIIEITTKVANRGNVWTTATRPSPSSTDHPIGFNSTTSQFEGWDGTKWVILG